MYSVSSTVVGLGVTLNLTEVQSGVMPCCGKRPYSPGKIIRNTHTQHTQHTNTTHTPQTHTPHNTHTPQQTHRHTHHTGVVLHVYSVIYQNSLHNFFRGIENYRERGMRKM